MIAYEYNDNGQVTYIKVTPNGQSQNAYAEFTYNDPGRMLTAERKNASASLVKNTFTLNSMTMRFDSESVRFWKPTSGYFDRTMEFTYNDDGTRASRADSFTSITLLYEYDDAGRLTLLTEEQQHFGMSMMTLYPAGVIARWDYDGAGRLAHQKYNSDKLVTDTS